MTVRFTQSNASGFVAVAGDALAAVTEDGSTAYANYIPTAWEGDAYSIDLQFFGAYADPMGGAATLLAATNVTTTFTGSQYGMTITKLNASTYRILGPVSNAFPSAYYRFTMLDGSVKVLPPNTTEPFLSLAQYKMPTESVIELEYPFSVTIPADPVLGTPPATESFSVKQYIHWRFASAVANVQAIVARGQR